jgi:hypothetical protein
MYRVENNLVSSQYKIGQQKPGGNTLILFLKIAHFTNSTFDTFRRAHIAFWVNNDVIGAIVTQSGCSYDA